MFLKKRGVAELPKVIKFGKIVGPSFILLGMGLGSGELLLWPYLSANYGMGIIWAAVLGITFQFFVNMEIERYTLATGESVFVGLARKFNLLSPIWFIISTLIPWMWPGIVLSSATVFGRLFGFENYGLIAILMLIVIGLTLTLGKVVYKTQELVQRTLILLGVPTIFLLTLLFFRWSDWSIILEGFIGKGDGYWFIPADLPLLTFLGAFAYAGAGGNLNLVQSFFIKEKGYGMGMYGGKITSILSGSVDKISLEGKDFTVNKASVSRFNQWWRALNLEHLLVFWLTGAITMIMLSLLAYFTVFHNAGNTVGIQFLFKEAEVIGRGTFPVLGAIFLTLAGAMLFSTQLSIVDATSRIMSENLVIINQKKFKISKLPYYYYSFLWLQILLSTVVILLGFKEPLQLVLIGAFLNAITMFVYTAAMLWLNGNSLPKEIRPTIFRKIVLIIVIGFFGFFSLATLLLR